MRKTVCLLIAIAVLALASLPAMTAAAANVKPDGATGGETAVGAGAVEAANRAVAYLKANQRSDGGFGEPGKSSSDQLTAWVVCGLAAAGQDVGALRKNGKSPLDFLASHVGNATKLTDIEKVCLAVACAGGNPRAFGGRDLVAAIQNSMGPDGNIGGLVNEHCWGIIALAASGVQIPANSKQWLLARQSGTDGGFSYSGNPQSDPDDTGAALQALIAAGENARSSAVTRALSYLHFCQAPDGGFAWQTAGSNTGSTAWAVQGISAAGEDVSSSAWSSSGKTPIDFLLKMQQADGHVRYMATSDANPVWMTAEAVPALLKKSYPLKASPANNDGDASGHAESNTSGTDSEEEARGQYEDGSTTDADPGTSGGDGPLSSQGGTGDRAESFDPLARNRDEGAGASTGITLASMSTGKKLGLAGIGLGLLAVAVCLGFVIHVGWSRERMSAPGRWF